MELKKNILKYVHADILILPETHCLPNQNIEIESYTLFHNNRKINANRNRGSGGIAIAIKNSILEDHLIVAIFNEQIDGQIGLKLKNCKTDLYVGIVGLYLSPDNYIFNSAAVLWEDLSDCDLLIGAGDVNSRTKDLLDHIPDIDGGLIQPRTNPDQNKNAHGNCFLTFFKENRAVILNGRVTPELN